MAKSPDAFRTISEVAEWLGVEAHVLRFWETKFTQVKPVKRAGGRRYYRPADMALLGGIRRLLHEDGMTIRGVQKILRENGAGHVAGLSPEISLDGGAVAAPQPRPDSAPPEAPAAPFRDASSAEGPLTQASAAADEDAPTLPFDLPEPPLGADHAPAPEAVASLDPPEAGSARPSVSHLLRRRPERLDPSAVAPVVERARRLATRLRSTPER